MEVASLNTVTFSVTNIKVRASFFIKMTASNINIRSNCQWALADGSFTTFVVPGIWEGLPFPGTQTELDVSTVVDILLQLGVNNYIVKKMVIVDTPEEPEVYERIRQAFENHKIKYMLPYADESGKLIYNLSDIEVARKIFSSA